MIFFQNFSISVHQKTAVCIADTELETDSLDYTYIYTSLHNFKYKILKQMSQGLLIFKKSIFADIPPF